MDLIVYKQKLEKAIEVINKAIAFHNFPAYSTIKEYYQNALDKINNGVSLTGEDIDKTTAGGRMMYEAPIGNQKLMNEIIDAINDLEEFID